MALSEIWMPSPNYSSRNVSGVRLLTLHTTEGARTIRDLGNFFKGNVQASSHHGSDNIENGVLGAYVYEQNNAWTQGNANPVCISLEQCTPSGAAAGWNRNYWLTSQERLLRNTALWLAEMARKYNIPLVALTASQAQGSGRGVCQHMNLGSWGGGHSDCGPGYPMDQVLAWAKGTATAPPVQPPAEEEEEMFAIIVPPGVGPGGSPDLGVSLPSTNFRAIGFGADVGLLSDTDVVKVRVAWHWTNNTGWGVGNIELSKARPKAVLSMSGKFDILSIRRLDTVPVTLYPNVA